MGWMKKKVVEFQGSGFFFLTRQKFLCFMKEMIVLFLWTIFHVKYD